MSLQSMTGFARAEGALDGLAWAWEARSVNARGLDVRFRAPGGFEALDPVVRSTLQKTFKRGNFSIGLSVRSESAQQGYRINQAFLDQIIAMLPELKAKAPDANPPSLDGLLGLRGVIEAKESELTEDARAAVMKAMEADIRTLFDGLTAARESEGNRLAAILGDQVAEVEKLTAQAAGIVKTHPEMIRKKLKDQIAELMEDSGSLDAERLNQEAAVAMTKVDVREELDRLTAHAAAARELVATDGAIGRKFDFLCQEFNREANTLCSKSPDADLTAVGLELKTVIDQLREQVQNIE